MQLGNALAPLAVAAAAWLDKRQWRPAIGSAAVGVGAWWLAKGVKAVVERGRPAAELPMMELRDSAPVEGLGFVSGHATVAFALATVLAALSEQVMDRRRLRTGHPRRLRPGPPGRPPSPRRDRRRGLGRPARNLLAPRRRLPLVEHGWDSAGKGPVDPMPGRWRCQARVVSSQSNAAVQNTAGAMPSQWPSAPSARRNRRNCFGQVSLS